MSASSNPSLYWFVARGSGIVAYLLLTAAVAVGIAVSRRWHSPSWPRVVVEASHRWLAVIFCCFLAVHTVTIGLDPFTHFGLRDITVPFGSAYRTLWLGLGVLAAELGVAIAASVAIRPWIGYRLWRGLHLLTYVLFPLSLLHSIGTGTDTTTLWATLVYAGSIVVMVGAVLWRTVDMPALHQWTRVAAVVGGLALFVWCFRGPYAPGWAAAAGTPGTLLSSGRQSSTPIATPPNVPTAVTTTSPG